MKRIISFLTVITLIISYSSVDAKEIFDVGKSTDRNVATYGYNAPTKRVSKPTHQATKKSRQNAPSSDFAMASGLQSNIEGYMLYNTNYDYTSWWKLNTSTAKSTRLWSNPAIDESSTGFVTDGTLYAFFYYDNFGLEYLETKMMMFDVETGELLNTIEFNVEDFSETVLVATYDEKEKTAYAYTYSADHNSSYFQKIDIETGEFTYLNEDETFSTNPVLAFAYNPADEKLYGVTLSGYLCEINKQTGEYTELFSIGFAPLYLMQSMVYSPFDKGFVYLATENDEYWTPRLVVLNLALQEATKDIAMTQEEQYTILYCNDPIVAEGGAMPAEIQSITFADLASDGEAIILLPEETFDGNRLTGELTVEIKIDGVQYGETLTKNVGEEITIELKNMAEGLHVLTVSTYSNGIKGVDAIEEFFIGKDAPAKPQNVVLSNDKITWDIVTTSAHNGYIEADKITYNVYLNDELLNTTPLTTNSYDIEPYVGEMKSMVAAVEAVYEDKVSAKGFSKEFLAGGYSIPVEFDVDEEMFDYMTIIDDNADAVTWYYNEFESTLEYEYSPYYKADDWAFFPPIHIEDASKVFVIEVDAKTYPSIDYTEKIEVGISRTDNLDDMKIILPEATLNVFDGTLSHKFNVDEAGNYRIAVHVVSDADNYWVRIPAIRVYETSSTTSAPAQCENITATAAEYGRLEATVNFTLPLVSLDGELLNRNEDIMVVVASEAGSVSVSAKPGTNQTVVVPTIQSDNIITLTPSNAAGEGAIATISIYTGVDIPGTATFTSSVVSEDNKSVTFTWETPSVGLNGKYVDPAFVTYQVVRYWEDFDYWFAESGVLDEAQYTFTLKDDDDQDLALQRLGIVSISAAGSTNSSEVLAVYLGNPYKMPIEEAFEDGESHYVGMTIEDEEIYTGSWSLDNPVYYVENAIHRDDLALVAMTEENTTSVASVVMPKFSTKGAEMADAIFNVYFYENMGEAEVFVRDYTGVETSIGKITGNEFEKGWNEVVFALPAEMIGKTWLEVIVKATLENKNEYFIIGGYKFKETSSVQSFETVNGMVIGGVNEIILKGMQSELVSIYTIDGKLVFMNNIENESKRIQVQPGIYIVKVGRDTTKVIVK